MLPPTTTGGGYLKQADKHKAASPANGKRGYYIHPQLHGAPEEKGIEGARHPAIVKRMKELRARQQQKAAQVAQVARP